jgi:hypothetical protein
MFGDPPRRRAEPFNGDQPIDAVGIDAGIAQCDHAAEGMGKDRYRRELLLVNQLSEIIDITSHTVIPVGRPLAVAVTAQVGRQHVPLTAQTVGHPIPVATMVPPAMNEQ